MKKCTLLLRIATLGLLSALLLSACAEKAPADASAEPSGQPESTVSGESTPESSEPEQSQAPVQKEVMMSYEIPEQFEDAYTDSFGVTDLKKMTISANANTYTIVYNYPEGGSYATQLVKKRWGMWMLGAMDHSTASGTRTRLIDSSTDFEWVLKCGKTAGSITFRGGNHGDYTASDWTAENTAKTNDHFIDMTFYDASTGKKLDLKNGESKTVNGLRVVIHNNIYEGEYTKEHVLICVEKIYLFNGEDVFVDSKLSIMQNMYFKTSYTCMMPIYKKYGNNIRFYNDDGTTKLVRTPTTGSSNYGNNFSDYNKASRVEMWGDDFPAYHMTMQIYNPDDQFLSSERFTRLWDMNPISNKLYFSAFSETASLVKKGTEWNYRTSWSFSYQPDFENPADADELVGFPKT